MPRDISIPAQTQADAESTFYTEIYNVNLGDGSTLYLTPTPPASGTGTVAFTFGGQVYSSFAVQRGTIQQTSDQELSGIAIQFQNVDQVFGSLIANNLNEIRGQTVTISGIFLASGTNAPISNSVDDLVPVIDGRVGQIRIDENNVGIQLTYDIEDVTVDSPRRFYAQADGFNFLPPIG